MKMDGLMIKAEDRDSRDLSSLIDRPPAPTLGKSINLPVPLLAICKMEIRDFPLTQECWKEPCVFDRCSHPMPTGVMRFH